MSSPRYCDNPEPHKGHEWQKEKWAVSGDGTEFLYEPLYFCWGVKNAFELRTCMIEVEQAELVLNEKKRDLAEWSVRFRRTETEFYEGDK